MKKEETSTSFLLIENAQPSDSGQYQCNPSNAKSKSVTVHVLNGNIWRLFVVVVPAAAAAAVVDEGWFC